MLASVHPNLIRRAVRNLIDNAIKFAGSADVSVVPESGEARIVVADHGPGIPELKLQGVMEPFVRLEDSRQRDLGGSGLGLAIARAIAQSHGGSLRLANRSPSGIAATLVIPASS